MRILFIVPYTPTPVRTRPYNLIRALAQRGNTVDVYTLWSDLAERQAGQALAEHGASVYSHHLSQARALWNCTLNLPGSHPLQAVYCWQPALARQLAQALQPGEPGYDVIHIEHLRGALYGLQIEERRRTGEALPPVVWDSVDCISYLFAQAVARKGNPLRRALLNFEIPRTRRFEARLVHSFARTLVTSHLDQQALAALNGAAPLATILPNGVDLERFHPLPEAGREPATLVVSGKMSYHANISMVHHLVEAILPHIWARRPETRLVVVGQNPPPKIMALDQHPNVEVTGTVPRLEPYLQKATVAVAPLTYGAGIQNKVLEAMACATPVVTTPKAVEALACEPGRDLLVADDPEKFAADVLKLLDEPAYRQQIGTAGRRYVESHHNWDQVAAQLETEYRSTIGQIKPTPISQAT